MHGEGRKSRKTICHSLGPVWLYLRSRGRMLMAAATAVKAARGITCCRERSCFGWSRSQNNRFAVASREIALVFRGAVGRIGLAAAEAHPVQRKPHALGRHRRAVLTERSRIDAHPRNLRGQPSILDLRAAVHDDLESCGFRLGRGRIV